MSAALQTATHPPPSLASMPPPSGHQYMSPHSSPNREAYHANQSATTSQSSRRPPSRRTSSSNGAPTTVEANAGRASRSTSARTPNSDRRPSTTDRHCAPPPAAPSRTSSSTHPVANSRRARHSAEVLTTSHQHAQPQGPRADTRVEADTQPPMPKSKRTSAGPYVAHDTGSRPTSSRDNRSVDASMPIRAHHTSPPKNQEMSDDFIHTAASAEHSPSRNGSGSHHASSDHEVPAPAPAVGTVDERHVGRSRHDHSRGHKGTSKFGDFILGNTIGEGEFGKVKLGWKQDSSVQVAIKLIKRDTVGGNPSRLSKIRREVSILRDVQHPNIVRLIDMLETDRYIGIILEYASGGELFDYILNHRYLKDHAARRLFAQLVSGVGYLHKKGIVHRDLKLENLLLDRNRNIIITDFGFANTFDPNEELTDNEELNLTDRDFVKHLGLDRIKANDMRKGDLMQTSCGSPCYAAPELVVSDSLYTGRKVDVWSCGVILYAMLAGYLPFDDDPANPEGDNINLLYKYIVSTPLTFPEYVTPHARDLLRRILVPNPRKRADLFEVARHSWLSEYAHLVEFITSSTTSPADVQNASLPSHGFAEPPSVARSASVRETPKHKSPVANSPGGLSKAHAKIDQDVEQAFRTPMDAKRRTVQVEYVAPTTQTRRGSDPDTSASQRPQPYEDSQRDEKPLAPATTAPAHSLASGPQSMLPPSSQGNTVPPRTSREIRAISENALLSSSSGTRPQTRGSLQSAASMGLQSRANYGQPVPPTIADTNVQGRIQQPSNGEDEPGGPMGRPSVGLPPKLAKISDFHEGRGNENRGHKRSSTIGDIGSRLIGRSGSVFGSGKTKKRSEFAGDKTKKYPPVSMSKALVQRDDGGPRSSMESKASRRPASLGLGKKRSGSVTGSQGSCTEKKERRRFSVLPVSFSLKAIGLGRDDTDDSAPETESQQEAPVRAAPARRATAQEGAQGSPPLFDKADAHEPRGSRHQLRRIDGKRPTAVPTYVQAECQLNSASESSVSEAQAASRSRGTPDYETDEGRVGGNRGQRGPLHKSHKRFTDAYEQGEYRGHEGSSGAAKRVMDFFRRRGRARGGDDR